MGGTPSGHPWMGDCLFWAKHARNFGPQDCLTPKSGCPPSLRWPQIGLPRVLENNRRLDPEKKNAVKYFEILTNQPFFIPCWKALWGGGQWVDLETFSSFSGQIGMFFGGLWVVGRPPPLMWVVRYLKGGVGEFKPSGKGGGHKLNNVTGAQGGGLGVQSLVLFFPFRADLLAT